MGGTPGSQGALREANQRRVLRAVRLAGSLTQTEIARTTQLSAATISNIVRDLRAAGAVQVTPTSSGGRRAQSVSLSRDAGLVAGIDFGHTHLRVALGDLAHHVIGERVIPLDVDHSAAQGLDRAQELIGELLDEVGAGTGKLVGVGLGMPGPLDAETRTVGSSTILPGWIGLSPEREMRARLDLPVYMDNDANLGALSELVWGAGRGLADLAYVKVATGVGAGLVVAGRVHRGADGIAGELGHISLDESGPVCRCGNRGCLETFAGAPFLLELLSRSHGASLTIAQVIAMAHEGDVGCRRVIADAGRSIGIATASLCNLLNPHRVIVGGDLATAGELLLDPIRAALSRYAIPGATRSLTVVGSELGARAEVLGALLLALHELEPSADVS